VREIIDQAKEAGLPRIYTAKEVAKILRITPQVLYRLVKQGRVRPLAAFGRLKISAEELSRFIGETR
jgi:predicted site-specific integrase-resolvase